VPLFSFRKQLKTLRAAIQIADIDVPLRTGLWNQLTRSFWQDEQLRINNNHLPACENLNHLTEAIWGNLWHLPLDSLQPYWPDAYAEIRQRFFKSPWYEVYDFLEFAADNYPDKFRADLFRLGCNSILEREQSGYRLIVGKISDIVSELEIEEVDTAIINTEGHIKTHLVRALELYSDRKQPDYRNSIKESISAVEAMCRHISGEHKATLGDALKAIGKKHPLHGALQSAFSALYGYTSDAHGIRHALLDSASASSAEARYFLIACSAFINFLRSQIS